MVAFTRGKRDDPRMLSPQMRAFYGEPVPSKRLMHASGGGVNPFLFTPIVVITSSTTATATVITNFASGTLFWIATVNGNPPPDPLQLEVGKDGKGLAAAASGSQSVSTLGVQTILITGLAGSTSYTVFVVQTG